MKWEEQVESGLGTSERRHELVKEADFRSRATAAAAREGEAPSKPHTRIWGWVSPPPGLGNRSWGCASTEDAARQGQMCSEDRHRPTAGGGGGVVDE